MYNIVPIILAAGKGTRMRSNLPKVLHPIGGRPMLTHVIEVSKKLKPEQVVIIVGHEAETVKKQFADESNLAWVLQTEQLGTGHALQQANDYLVDGSVALILYGDVPLTPFAILKQLVAAAKKSGFALLTALLDDPTGYGRVVRENDKVTRIVEQKDASPAELAIDEINTGIMAINSNRLKPWLADLKNDTSQGEYYLTDVVAMAVRDGIDVKTIISSKPIETYGINDRKQQAEIERYYQKRKAQKLMKQSVSLIDPARIEIRGEMNCGQDVSIDINCIFEGEVSLADNVEIGANCIIKNSKIATGCKIHANTIIENSIIGQGCEIGPFARIRPETTLKNKAKIGNFVEVKKSIIGSGSKVNHLSYVGDTKMGAQCNIGAGTITCNYDGANKHQTSIGNNVFVGSDTQLVAPVTIDDDVTIGAGTTITKDVLKSENDNEVLALSRTKQTIIKKWQRAKKK